MNLVSGKLYKTLESFVCRHNNQDYYLESGSIVMLIKEIKSKSPANMNVIFFLHGDKKLRTAMSDRDKGYALKQL